MNKYLKQSKIFPNNLAQDILMRLNLAENEQALNKKRQLFVNDELFEDNF